jgi:hypothetical protein
MYALLMAAALTGVPLRLDGSGPVRVTQAIRRDISPNLGELSVVLPTSVNRDGERIDYADTRAGHTLDDRVAQRFQLTGPSASVVRNFEGMGEGLGGRILAPPDPNGDVGPHHYLQVTNGLFAVFAKSGLLLFGPTGDFTIWKGLDGACARFPQGDPIAVYDGLADRWVMSYQAREAIEGRQCIAVSQTSDPLGAWYRYEISFPSRNDYSKLAVWPSAYILTTGLPDRTEVCALDRARMLAGAPTTQQCFNVNSHGSVLPADLDGAQQPPPGSPAYVFDLLSLDSTLGVFKLSIDWEAPSHSRISGRIPVSVAAWVPPCPRCISQPGTSQQLSTLGGYIMNRVTYRNFGDHEAFLINHSADVQGTVGIRWYELRPDSGGNLLAFQQGTFGPDANHRWMASIAMDQQGNIALGYSAASAQLYPSIRYVGRLAEDPLGMMTLSEGSLFEGNFSQTWNARWGDYSAMQVDPIDDCTFWYTTEYAGRSSPGTRIGAFRLPGCESRDTFALEVQPSDASITVGNSVMLKITSRVTAGLSTPLDLRIDGLPLGVRATFAASTIAAGESTEVILATDPSTPATAFRSLSVEGTSSSFQAHALGRIQVETAVPTAAPRNSGCSSTGAAVQALLVIIAGMILHQSRRKRRR